MLRGVKERGEGGVLWADGDECTYCFPDEFPNKAFADGLTDMLARPGSREAFFLVHPAGGRAHVLCYPRHRVVQEVCDAAVATAAAVRIQRAVRRRKGK